MRAPGTCNRDDGGEASALTRRAHEGEGHGSDRGEQRGTDHVTLELWRRSGANEGIGSPAQVERPAGGSDGDPSARAK